jgi:hypothetical protein
LWSELLMFVYSSYSLDISQAYSRRPNLSFQESNFHLLFYLFGFRRVALLRKFATVCFRSSLLVFIVFGGSSNREGFNPELIEFYSPYSWVWLFYFISRCTNGNIWIRLEDVLDSRGLFDRLFVGRTIGNLLILDGTPFLESRNKA